ncbi:imidazole glycerol phosphate synthase subunit HisH [Nostoc sp. TCL26-01]|uniref:imidazole glycerol phosphate synthase subunit HisH n=1 Tax=Nostoc sp. TCL26-01 TaxID=2576904 RepID=UPI0015C069F2|nr:imidazole glycerol phosphate synthase subunit HisH [Nostoc sp. TCL26-01]QLE59135.1 imidazole glycerol phosphate synthase subunit HisH [Nostoc sp. TCL26-01]
MIGIVDYGMGNLLSVYNALEMVGADVKICQQASEIRDVKRIVLPGVGAFRDCIFNLKEKGFIEVLEEMVLIKGQPFLGICLGMQAISRRSFEGGENQGLGWLDADVVKLQPEDSSLRVPQVGWNDVQYRHDSPLFLGLPSAPDFYFVHSYHMRCDRQTDVDATCEYGEMITVAIRKNNIFATQFHPEKSQNYGLQVLQNFLKWNP